MPTNRRRDVYKAMRDCTPAEKGKLARGICPDCGSESWYGGPEGGMCKNWMCAGCGSRFNLGMGPLHIAQRIGGTNDAD